MKSNAVSNAMRYHLVLLASTATMLLGVPFVVGLGGLPAASAQTGAEGAASLTTEVQGHIDRAQEILDQMLAVSETRTVENTLERLNDLSIELDAAAAKSSLMENVHPDADVRAAAEKGSQDVQSFATALSLNRDVYDAVLSVEAPGDDPATQRYLERTLRDYRRSGVDKDEATREKIKSLREELVELGQEFDRNIRDGVRSIHLESVEELDGLPEDYIASHQPDETGKIEITTRYPDYIPFLTYAKSREARERIYHEYNNRAYPENKDTLKKVMVKRHELATALGYDSWAAYITEDKMIESTENAAKFLELLNSAAKARAEKDYTALLERKRKDDPNATAVADFEKSYYRELVKTDQYDFDSQELRDYFSYPLVKQGILDITAKMFGVSYKPISDAEVWHESVDGYEVFEGSDLIGRFYLDMHPREGKFSHAAQFTLKTGVKDRQIPVAVLVCNFPGGDDGDPGLMEHDDVETYLHEFGHLLHHLFGGHQRWIDFSGVATEWDFVEAPSQMLEEWALDINTLRLFARHHETGEPIPAELVEKLRVARDFGNGIDVRQQTFYSAISLKAYDQNPDEVNLDELVPELQAQFGSFAYVPETHMYASFGHLEGYSAMYYTYMWSKVIAKDLFSKFDPEDMLNPETATQYRKQVLTPGGTKDAADLVKDFLGRKYSFDAFRAWLNRAS